MNKLLRGKKLILASGSPRRKELLGNLDVDFEVDTQNNFKEEFNSDTPHESIPVIMAEGKSLGFHRPLCEDEILITADTMVLCSDEVLGKPGSREDAIHMLRLLSAREHKVITAVTLRSVRRMETFSDVTYVQFKELSDDEITYYVDEYKPFDKAGAYGVQEWIGYVGITGIRGSFYNVMGLPVHLLYEKLKQM